MPLTFLSCGQEATIKHITGRDETKKFLESMGFIRGEKVKVVSSNSDNLIILVRGTRLALDNSMAFRIHI
ncbi:MAG: FeoA family protein [Synergistaceae bacterium]